MNTSVLRAVFRRNFVSYFANPTGYLFICGFVWLGAFAAFWPNEFFNANLANLDQLNAVFPFVMLVFVPAITMSIWADERRQGTDELLLTIPASDLDIVVGKYLAAVAIYTVALAFSAVCNYLVLNRLASASSTLALLPQIDLGLFLGTYAGYWLAGLAMLAVGMVASFLTGNVTVAYILGALFNVPLVFAATADVIFENKWAELVKQWSIGFQFRDFGRGVIGLSGLAFFGLIALVMLYLSMVLIARRHWIRSRQWHLTGLHYLVRAISLAAVIIGANVILTNHDQRLDVTSQRLNSLSPATVSLLGELDLKRPVQIEAFISPNVPESYVQTRLNLLAMLDELESRGRGKIQVRINDTERFSPQAELAEKRYGISPREVTTLERGVWSKDFIFMNVTMSCGLRPAPPLFVDRGLPVEYELVRSLCTVAQQKKRRLGVLNTDVPLFARFNPMQGPSAGGNWPIIDELEKQYEVVQVDPHQPITEKYDVLLAVQPSSLGPEEMDNFIAAVRGGQATAIFEDPFPAFNPEVPGTGAPRTPPGGMQQMMMMGQQQMPKGDIQSLWNLLGVDFDATHVLWQDYNPYQKAADIFPKQFIFVDKGSGAEKPFNPDDPATRGLQHLLLPFAGAIRGQLSSDLEFQPLLETGDKNNGTVALSDLVQITPWGRTRPDGPPRLALGNTSYVLAARIKGKLKPNAQMAGEEAATEAAEKAKPQAAEAKPQAAEIDVILVADMDMLARDFFQLRERGDVPEAGMNFDFDNVTFVLNVLDELAGDDRFLALRSRRPKHCTLARIEALTEGAKKEAAQQRDRFSKEFNDAIDNEQKALEKRLDELKNRKDANTMDIINEVAIAAEDGQRRIEAKKEQLSQQRDREINRVDTELNVAVRNIQHQYKLWAVLLPPIPPLLVALAVFLRRRSRESEGVARSRLR